jgi:hypothetical protein
MTKYCAICGRPTFLPSFCEEHEREADENEKRLWRKAFEAEKGDREMTDKDATHKFLCRHCVSAGSCREYYMRCIPLGSVTGAGKIKCLVFGDRYWKRDKQSIRYVDADRLKKIIKKEAKK